MRVQARAFLSVPTVGLALDGGLPHNRAMALLAREAIEAALTALDAELGRAGERASLYLVGGAVMCLVLRTRESTKDVDGWFEGASAVRAAAGAYPLVAGGAV